MTLNDLLGTVSSHSLRIEIMEFARDSKYWEKMVKAVKKRWVRALRSGEYEQCKDQLVRVDRNGNERFCCLGVVTHEEGTGDWHLASSTGKFLRYRGRNGKKGNVACSVDLKGPGYVYFPAGVTLRDMDPDKNKNPDPCWIPPDVADVDIHPEVREKIKLDERAAGKLARFNDMGLTFEQLAFLIDTYL
jgi:hypothetical protein